MVKVIDTQYDYWPSYYESVEDYYDSVEDFRKQAKELYVDDMHESIDRLADDYISGKYTGNPADYQGLEIQEV